ncbi:unnamed protein product, partial [Coregonus sp. 'balchen']
MILKAANSPRPGNWALERSLDRVIFTPWQYYAITDTECLTSFNILPRSGLPSYTRYDEVICTSFYSKIQPLENGEFQRIRTLNADLMTLALNDARDVDPIVTRRYYYSIKDISVGGMCICYGHAKACPVNNQTKTVGDNKQSLNSNGEYVGGGVCVGCTRNTAGVNCQTCADGYYRPTGVSPEDSDPCQPCSCDPPGSLSPACVPDQSQAEGVLTAGSCQCMQGYRRQQCDRCAIGYSGYPNCGWTHQRDALRLRRANSSESPQILLTNCSSIEFDSSFVVQISWLLPPLLLCALMSYTCHTLGKLTVSLANYTISPQGCQGAPLENSPQENAGLMRDKENVEGENCDHCKLGFYHLCGCEKCYCSGVASDCSDSQWIYSNRLPEYTLQRFLPVRNGAITTRLQIDKADRAASAERMSAQENMHGWVPFWTCTITHYAQTKQDSILEAVRGSEQSPLFVAVLWVAVYPFTESTKRTLLYPEHFENQETGLPVSMKDFMMALINVTSLLIKASHSNERVAIY